MSAQQHAVDELFPVPLTLGLQHVLVMYAGAVAVPLIIGRLLKLPPEDVAFLISADLFTCGLASLIRSVGFPGVAMISLVSPTFFKNMLDVLHPLLDSGIQMAAVVSVTLNVFFNGVRSEAEARADFAMIASSSEHV